MACMVGGNLDYLLAHSHCFFHCLGTPRRHKSYSIFSFLPSLGTLRQQNLWSLFDSHLDHTWAAYLTAQRCLTPDICRCPHVHM